MTNLEALANRLNQMDTVRAQTKLELDQAVRELRAAGVPISVLARRAGVSRQTVYTILKEEK